MTERFLPGVPGEAIERLFKAAPGNEIERGKFDSLESSAALAANAFGWFLYRARKLPPLPGCGHVVWPARSVALEQTVRCPWCGGRHPVLDALVTTQSAFIGIESKRFEPFRARTPAGFSAAYWRPVWGKYMQGYERVRDRLRDKIPVYHHLGAAQLVKHAFALRIAVHDHRNAGYGLMPILFYIHAEPAFWPKSRTPVGEPTRAGHRTEIDHFAGDVAGDEVQFIACSYRVMLADWQKNTTTEIRAHAAAVFERFAP